ncbi:hypothetical protein PPEP_a0996 [Pseudoalteromonas peptidolytica F12-50-A1]|uniref:Uncharacterized protein n=1 Tax=Pseudoalteromonas peptidolytica F12-50-A1 TaxID=1315280 RepID=A0A8I0MUG7_9GAMM|nr:hypothetical protein [Pseudoalteromonas peptidolytica F12-50-A1]
MSWNIPYPNLSSYSKLDRQQKGVGKCLGKAKTLVATLRQIAFPKY